MGSPICPRPPSNHTPIRLFLYLLFIDSFTLLSFVFSPTRLHRQGPSRHSVSNPLSGTVPHAPTFLDHFSASSRPRAPRPPSPVSPSLFLPHLPPHRGLHPRRLPRPGGPSGTHGAGRASPRVGDTRLLPLNKRPRDLRFTRHETRVTSCPLRGPGARRRLRLLAPRDGGGGGTARARDRRLLAGGGRPPFPLLQFWCRRTPPPRPVSFPARSRPGPRARRALVSPAVSPAVAPFSPWAAAGAQERAGSRRPGVSPARAPPALPAALAAGFPRLPPPLPGFPAPPPRARASGRARSGRSSRPRLPPPPSAHPFSSSRSPAVRSRPRTTPLTPLSSGFGAFLSIFFHVSLTSSPRPSLTPLLSRPPPASALLFPAGPLARSRSLHTPVFIFLLFSISRLLCSLPPLSFLLPALLSSPVPLGFGLCIRAASKLSAPCFPLSLPFLPLSPPAVWAFLPRLPGLLPGRSSARPSISNSVPSSLSLLLLPPASLSPPRSPFLTPLRLLRSGPPPTPACLLSHLSLPFPLSSFLFFPPTLSLHLSSLLPCCSSPSVLSPRFSSPPPSSLSHSFLSLLFESVTSSLLPDFSPPLASFPLHLVFQCQGGPSRLCQPHLQHELRAPLPLPLLLPSPFLKFGADILPGISAAWNRAAKPGLPTPTPPPRVEGPL
ncbi:proline-rich protein 36-like [Lutra lutra]|uniref:proline-rich protein 36-like n=1 Tax=Lutra lutra TaxID=9657 RepID=UPI001FD600FF|nr:proline-rich protein 36-like [Lutra lutra]XP_047567473.1 proline-rich protein 36-like [Lutra lutra]